MSKSMRIVLVDPLGDVLFSGESMIAMERPSDEVEEVCPATKRSATSESGVFPIAAPGRDEDQDGIATLPENGDEIRSARTRAA